MPKTLLHQPPPLPGGVFRFTPPRRRRLHCLPHELGGDERRLFVFVVRAKAKGQAHFNLGVVVQPVPHQHLAGGHLDQL